MRACSASEDCSGVVMETSSHLVNWCWRIIPRVSPPVTTPASERKQGVRAVKRRGSCSSGVICSRTRLVKGDFGGGD